MLITSSLLADLILFLVGGSFALYFYFTRNFNYWKKRGVPYIQPLPIFGNAKDLFFFKKTIGDWLKEFYDNAKDDITGLFIFDEPCVLITSPLLAKMIMVQDFNYFTDRTVALPEHNKLFYYVTFFQRGAEWKTLRSKLTPLFTSGKLKFMHPLVKGICDNLIIYLRKNQGVQEAKEICSKYTTDIICKCAFGINAHCLEDEQAIFRKLSRSMGEFSLRNAVCQTSYFFKPNWVSTFKLDFFAPWIQDYFRKAFWDTMNKRRELNFKANDLIDMLKDMMDNQELPDFVGDKVAAQATQFFAAGFDTTAITISFTLYELAVNPHIQDKVRADILDVNKENGISYEGLTKTKYLDLCIKETLRKYPPLPFYDRRCLADYKVPGTNFVIEKGMAVYIPVYGFQLDEKYFPEPQKYNPDRFLENVNNDTDGLIYMPFGEGPRSCIGERFAMMTTKTALVYILTNFEVQKCSKTPEPVEFEPRSFVFKSKVGVPINFKEINR